MEGHAQTHSRLRSSLRLLHVSQGTIRQTAFVISKRDEPHEGGIPGATIYESTCNCSFAKNYPYAFGPRLGIAYQFAPKTVLRVGVGISYDGTATGATGTGSAAPSNTFSAPGFGTEAMTLNGGVPQQYVLPWPNFRLGLIRIRTSRPSRMVRQAWSIATRDGRLARSSGTLEYSGKSSGILLSMPLTWVIAARGGRVHRSLTTTR